MNEEISKKPELRFPEYNDEYNSGRFEDLFIFKKTNSLSRDQLNYSSGSVLNVHYGDIHTKLGMIVDIDLYNLSKVNESIEGGFDPESYCTDGDVIIADASEDYEGVGKAIELINIRDRKVVSGLHTILARPILDTFSRGYLGYYMNSKYIHDQIKFYAVGTKVYSISKSNLNKILVSYPSIVEQKKIADFLKLIDQSIENLEEKIRLLELQKKAIVSLVFSRKNNIGYKGGHDTKDWDAKLLGDICKITTGKLDANAMDKNGAYRFYTCAKDFSLIDVYAFDTDALLISGNGANVGYIHHYKGKFNAYQRTYVLDQFSHNISYVKFFLEKNLSYRIETEKKAGNTPYIVLSTLSMMPILCPSLTVQEEISGFFSLLDHQIDLNVILLDNMKLLKNSLFQKMFV